ncbi:retrovirus-related pol polyprotein from transposon TNT 1-94 [Tanacetum coccineum]
MIAPGMYKMNTRDTQTRTPQLHPDIRNTNKRMSFSTGVIPTTSISTPQLKSIQLEDRVLLNNSQVKKKEVEEHRRNIKFSKNKLSVTACNDSLTDKTSNVNFVCVTYGKCVLNENHDLYVLHYINGVNSRTKKPIVVPISTREPKRTLVEIILFILDSGCSKHMTGNLKLLVNFLEKFLGTVRFGNDQFAPILGYGDLVQGNFTIKRKSTCYVRDLKGNDLLTATSSQEWLWHRHLSYLNFDTINLLSKNDIVNGLPKLKFIKDHLCSSCDLGKAKQKSFKTKTTPRSKGHLQLLHVDLCGPMRVESINGKKYVLRTLRTVRTDRGMEFLNKTLHEYFSQEGIEQQTSTAQTPKQNGIVKGQNHTLVEAAQTMLSAAKIPLFFWAGAITTTCFTQNRSLLIPRHEKIPYHIINGRKPTVKFFHIFGSFCYIVRDGENLDKMKEKGDACIFVGYSTQSKGHDLQSQENVPLADETVTTSLNELDMLFSPMFDEYFNRATLVVSKSSIVPTTDAFDKRH